MTDGRAIRTAGVLSCVGLIGIVSVAASSDTSLKDPLEAGWNGQAVCELLQESAEQRMLRCTFAPGVGHERHFHTAHVGYVIEGGRMRIRDDSGVREVELRTGYSWESDGVAWHEVLNVGDTTSVYLIVEPRSGPANRD